MRAGKLNRRLQIDVPQTDRNEVGEEILTWLTLGVVWASIEPIKGNEALKNNQILADMDTRIKIRWSDGVKDISPKWRLSHAGVIYNIVSIANVGTSNKEFEIMAKSGLNNG
jgi:SPP1 family predicted phage head-tail adaptor